ncbi:hypothetical protein HDU76_003901 [Blyttiomyces sp. JEL0837]|nr:hypothetical protein HDU76_003901 [Blyttiomyces sp. JEL0837]
MIASTITSPGRLYTSTTTRPPNSTTTPLDIDPSAKPSDGHSFSKPGPIPLGDRHEQQEFEDLVKKALEPSTMDQKHPDAEKMPLKGFEGDRNPVTGEVGGPKGVEPTRYGDWERKGRVFDF